MKTGEDGTESTPCCLASVGSLTRRTYDSFGRIGQLDSATMKIITSVTGDSLDRFSTSVLVSHLLPFPWLEP